MQRFRVVCGVKKMGKSYVFMSFSLFFLRLQPIRSACEFLQVQKLKQLELLRCVFFPLWTCTDKCQNFTELFVCEFQNAYGSFSWKPFFYSIFVDFARFSASAKSFVNAELHHFKTVFQQSFTKLARSFALRFCVCR